MASATIKTARSIKVWLIHCEIIKCVRLSYLLANLRFLGSIWSTSRGNDSRMPRIWHPFEMCLNLDTNKTFHICFFCSSNLILNYFVCFFLSFFSFLIYEYFFFTAASHFHRFALCFIAFEPLLRLIVVKKMYCCNLFADWSLYLSNSKYHKTKYQTHYLLLSYVLLPHFLKAPQ